MQLYTAEQTRTLDRCAIEDFGIPGYELMKRAGRAAFAVIGETWPEAQHIAVVCGTGNNAGDGYVLATLAHAAGHEVSVFQLGDREKIGGDALEARQDMEAVGIQAVRFTGELPCDVGVIVDALFGTGLDRQVEGLWKQAIIAINTSPAAVLSIDIPSGLHADTGRILGEAVIAERTVSFIALKRGLYTGSGPDVCGEIIFNDLAVPREIYGKINSTTELRRYPWRQALLPRRRHASHKGDYGHVLVVGGNHGMAGAARMAGEAAARVGAGLVSIASRRGHGVIISGAVPELMVHEIDSATALVELMTKSTVTAIGPGLGQDAWARQLFLQALEAPDARVIDADALNLLALEPTHRDNWILTPHPGEAARLLNTTAMEVQADRFAAANEIQRRFGGVCILKGAGTVIASQQGAVVCETGNSGMASGGMGDVLTGVLAGLLAQDKHEALPLQELAIVAVLMHGQAADLAAQDGLRGLLASDLIPHLRHLADHA